MSAYVVFDLWFVVLTIKFTHKWFFYVMSTHVWIISQKYYWAVAGVQIKNDFYVSFYESLE